MDRRSSIASASHLPNGHHTQTKPQTPPNTRARSQSTKEPIDYANLQPDDLFTKYTVAEVKFVQQKLREDADAKQEELRLMVGERYRDLLQASTSIISIAQSSRRVNEALQESKAIILGQKQLPEPSSHASIGSQDTHLRTLQLLSAHMKLLLDSPEHLWRLMEKKLYYSAAWLFLLARVVHRALARVEENEDSGWLSQGIDVLEQFPIVQRQWETISHFRSQIIHRTSMSLRETVLSSENACGAVLTLHLLDSKPLTETFTIFLNQRSKALHGVLSPSGRSTAGNGQIPRTANQKSNRTQEICMPEVKQKLALVLDAISSTAKVARETFLNEPERPSLLIRVLEHIQSDSSILPLSPGNPPPELLLSTETLLSSMPSSTHLLLLPPTLRSYKPYVDLASPALSLPQPQIIQKFKAWFMDSLSATKTTIEQWFSELRDVRQVWSAKTFIQNWLQSSDAFHESEYSQLTDAFTCICQKRVHAIMKESLFRSQSSFKLQLADALISISQDANGSHLDKEPIEFLYQAPPLPTSSLSSVSFQQYKTDLRLRLQSRTTLLDQVLATLEDCARSLQHDLSHILKVESSADRPTNNLCESYRPDAISLCSEIVTILNSIMDDCSPDIGTNSDCLGFTSRVAHALSRTSPFIVDIGCGQDTETDFRNKTKSIENQLLERWRACVTTRVVEEYHQASTTTRTATCSSPGPSSRLLGAILSLRASVQQLGSSHQDATDIVFELFINDLLKQHDCFQSLDAIYDLVFMRRLVDTCPKWANLRTMIDDVTSKVTAKLADHQTPVDVSVFQNAIADSFLRTQTLTSIFLHNPTSFVPFPGSEPADKFAPLLPHGPPCLDKQFLPAFDVADPSTRFGILLVEGSASR